MSSTRQPIVHAGMLGGMDATTPPHMLDAQTWFFARDVRNHNGRIEQNKLMRLLGQTATADKIYGIFSIPVGHANHCHFLAISKSFVYQLRLDSIVSSAALNFIGAFETTEFVWNFTSFRPTFVFYNNHLWFSSRQTEPIWTDGQALYRTNSARQYIGAPLTLDHTGNTISLSGYSLPAGTGFVLGGTLPLELVAGKVYYSVSPTQFVFGVSETVGGAAIDFSSNGSGVTLSTVQPSSPQPMAAYIEVFFDHLFAANLIYKGQNAPWQVRWSHLYDFTKWEPSPENEADFYDVVGWQEADFAENGITGMKKLGDTLLIYTPDAIVSGSYIGLPKVMHFRPLDTTQGNSFPNTLASNGESHFFYDEKVQDFFRLDKGGAIKSIGQPIKQQVLDKTTIAQRRAMFTQVLTDFEEIWWTVDDDTFVDIFVFNWRYEKWFIRSRRMGATLRPLMSIGPRTGYRAKTVDELTGTIDGLTGQMNDLVSTISLGESYRLYGDNVGQVLRDHISTDLTSDLLDGQLPFLETGDRVYGDAYTRKETDAITIHAAFRSGTGGGIQVVLLKRENMGSALVSVNVGTWDLNTPHRRLTFPRQFGTSFRWRFTFTDGTRPVDFEFYGFQEHVYMGKAEA